MEPLRINERLRRFDALIGTGGIGTGHFFALSGNQTLGREESRSGRFLENRDYAKLHIIAHYMQTLMGPSFKTYPIGALGVDDASRYLCEEMNAAGLDLSNVVKFDDAPTMDCICLLTVPRYSAGSNRVSISCFVKQLLTSGCS